MNGLDHAVASRTTDVLSLRGLNPHIEDIARRIALENYVAFAPDSLTPLGGYPGDEDKARELFAKLDKQNLRGRVQQSPRALAPPA